jgi:hypothetical protein
MADILEQMRQLRADLDQARKVSCQGGIKVSVAGLKGVVQARAQAMAAAEKARDE